MRFPPSAAGASDCAAAARERLTPLGGAERSPPPHEAIDPGVADVAFGTAVEPTGVNCWTPVGGGSFGGSADLPKPNQFRGAAFGTAVDAAGANCIAGCDRVGATRGGGGATSSSAGASAIAASAAAFSVAAARLSNASAASASHPKRWRPLPETIVPSPSRRGSGESVCGAIPAASRSFRSFIRRFASSRQSKDASAATAGGAADGMCAGTCGLGGGAAAPAPAPGTTAFGLPRTARICSAVSFSPPPPPLAAGAGAGAGADAGAGAGAGSPPPHPNKKEKKPPPDGGASSASGRSQDVSPVSSL